LSPQSRSAKVWQEFVGPAVQHFVQADSTVIQGDIVVVWKTAAKLEWHLCKLISAAK